MDIATVAVIALPSATIGAFLAYTFLPAKGEGSPNMGSLLDDLFVADHADLTRLVHEQRATIERLTRELEQERLTGEEWFHKYRRAEMEIAPLQARERFLIAENRDLHADIAEKAKRLSDAGLQSAGGCDDVG